MSVLAPPLRPSASASLSTPTLPTSKSRRPLPLQRRSTLKRSIDDTNTMSTPSSPSKRAKVTFDSDVEIVSADEEDDLDPAVAKEQVRRAIERHRYRDDEAYEQIRGIFTADPQKERAPSPKSMKIHLQAIVANVASLSKDCSSLVSAVLSSEWVGRDDVYFTLFVRFLNNLAAAQRGFQGKIMQMLVELLGPQKTRRLPDMKPVRQPKIHERVFRAIQHITINVPSAPAALADRLSAKLNFEFNKAEERMTFIRNFMQLIDYVAELTSDILNNIMRELIKLDVCIQDSLDDVEEEVEEELLQYMSTSQTIVHSSSQTLVPETTSYSDEDDISSSDDTDFEDDSLLTDPSELRHRKLKDDIKQVDQIMDLLFTYYDRLITGTDLTTRHNTISSMIDQFKQLVLPTYRSRHPQFLIFHFAQSDPIMIDQFVTSCVEILGEKREAPLIRHAAAAYFSGFVGRGRHVPATVVQDCLTLLCDYMETWRKQYEPLSRGVPDMKRFGDFYALFQAILYIFCFRWRDIASTSSYPDLDDDEDDDDAFGDDDQAPQQYHIPEYLKEALQSAIYSPLNPLRVCTTAVVQQFAQLSMDLQLFYIYSKIEDNKRVRSTGHWRGISDIDIHQGESSNQDAWMGENGMLEGYFPYDPYHLPVSRRWIEDDYVEWEGSPVEHKEEETESEVEMGDENNEGEL